jgi:DNA repair protein RadC
MIVREAVTKYKKIGEINNPSNKMDNPEKVREAVIALFDKKELDYEKEHFLVLILNRKNGLKGIEVVTIGTQSSSLVHAREVFRTAVRDSAAAIIVAHNHPSGDPAPSSADIRVTRQLREASEIMGIELLDHVIVGTPEETDDGTGYYSFNDNGLL